MTTASQPVRSLDPDGRRRGRVRFVAGCLLIAGVWFGWLPRLSQTESMSRYLNEIERKGIDPSAMFYTELPMMSGLLEKLESGRRQERSRESEAKLTVTSVVPVDV